MEQKTTLTIIGVIAVFAIGYLLGNASFTKSDTMHRMPDGSMMHSKDMDMDDMMHSMNAGLQGKTGDAFDQAFLQEMIVHHQGAVEMAEQVLTVSKRPELIKLANDIIKAQTGEISMMQGWLDKWFAERMIGGDKDSHGCIASAGYTWNESKQACARSWEQ